jgi:hypothetical protein
LATDWLWLSSTSSVSSDSCAGCWVCDVESSLNCCISSVMSVDTKSVSAMKIRESHNVSLFVFVKRHRWSLDPFHDSLERHSTTFASLQTRRSWSSEIESIFESLEVLGILKLGGTWYFYGASEMIHLWFRSLWFFTKNYKTVLGAEVVLYQFESNAIVSLEMFKITLVSFVLHCKYKKLSFQFFLSLKKKTPVVVCCCFGNAEQKILFVKNIV